jgi:hypothetical protein
MAGHREFEPLTQRRPKRLQHRQASFPSATGEGHVARSLDAAPGRAIQVVGHGVDAWGCEAVHDFSRRGSAIKTII